LFRLLTRPQPSATPFPYTTLFRSSPRNHWPAGVVEDGELHARRRAPARARLPQHVLGPEDRVDGELGRAVELPEHGPEIRERLLDRKSTRLNSSHGSISYAVFCLK